MSFQSFSELKDLDDVKLSQEIVDAKKSLFDMRLKKATRQTFKPHLFKHTKRKIAQLMTIERQRKENKN
jgi:large subunit ribosomal protein L29|uniref:Large ribosomal subunit protein uL29c n=1 Tax=Teleaulax amphioxeia TaxID=77931 RepID=A0A0H4SMC4_9CRYP|nr:ribosomal protein L29 [Teleaulax amphioxeia]AKP94684.1 ribosomal protein L29 [Teleaulax amphioxeia]|tara:strand:+ start:14369 stop:14575 length:207 start_codon:yes stop_codon:yes gene_type:complete